jgi:hypothetical protein
MARESIAANPQMAKVIANMIGDIKAEHIVRAFIRVL